MTLIHNCISKTKQERSGPGECVTPMCCIHLSAFISTPEINQAGAAPWLCWLLEARERDVRGSAFLNNQLAAFFS